MSGNSIPSLHQCISTLEEKENKLQFQLWEVVNNYLFSLHQQRSLVSSIQFLKQQLNTLQLELRSCEKQAYCFTKPNIKVNENKINALQRIEESKSKLQNTFQLNKQLKEYLKFLKNYKKNDYTKAKKLNSELKQKLSITKQLFNDNYSNKESLFDAILKEKRTDLFNTIFNEKMQKLSECDDQKSGSFNDNHSGSMEEENHDELVGSNNSQNTKESTSLFDGDSKEHLYEMKSDNLSNKNDSLQSVSMEEDVDTQNDNSQSGSMEEENQEELVGSDYSQNNSEGSNSSLNGDSKETSGEMKIIEKGVESSEFRNKEEENQEEYSNSNSSQNNEIDNNSSSESEEYSEQIYDPQSKSMEEEYSGNGSSQNNDNDATISRNTTHSEESNSEEDSSSSTTNSKEE
ncbi:hypothetical protein QTN25_003121 [Entamoeba marina]